jgi:RNA polymerase sigma factor (sigma-70 family)
MRRLSPLDKNVEIDLLMDFYGNLLTDRQREIMTLYYEDNLSLTEIAEMLGITKQGVSDNIKRAEKALYDTEEKLQLLKQHLDKND